MIQVRQTVAPGEGFGDCQDACLASILHLNIEDTRVAQTGDQFQYIVGTQAMLERYGYNIVVIDLRVLPSGYWLASVPSLNKRGGFHMVVMHGDTLAWDPSLGKRYVPGKGQLDTVRQGYALAALDPAVPAGSLDAASGPPPDRPPG